MSREAHLRWEQVWLAEAVRLAEEAGPLDDSQALARAQRLPATEKDQLLERAWLLGQRLGWTAQMKRVRDAGWLLLLLVAGAILALTNGLLFSVLTDGRSINAASGFVSALGFHSVSLLFWLVSIPLARNQRRPGGGLSIGRWLMAGVVRLPMWRGPQTASLMQAGTLLVVRERLSPWAFGLLSHLIWTFGFGFVLLGLLFAFAFREYQLTWETTILAPEWFAAFARVTGYLPSLLGVPVPDLSPTAAAAGAGTGALSGMERAGAWPAREAAAWLLACVALYGLLPRALCVVWCAWVMRRAARRVDIDLTDPYYQRLRARLQALERAEVTDAEHPGPRDTSRARPDTGVPHTGFAVVGFELGCDGDWLPAALESSARIAVCIAGSMPEQVQLQSQLASLQPARLLVVCNPQASPDRGTLRFLRGAGLCAGQCALTFAVQPATGDSEDASHSNRAGLDRWRVWTSDNDLRGWQVFDDASAAAPWALEAA